MIRRRPADSASTTATSGTGDDPVAGMRGGGAGAETGCRVGADPAERSGGSGSRPRAVVAPAGPAPFSADLGPASPAEPTSPSARLDLVPPAGPTPAPAHLDPVPPAAPPEPAPLSADLGPASPATPAEPTSPPAHLAPVSPDFPASRPFPRGTIATSPVTYLPPSCPASAPLAASTAAAARSRGPGHITGPGSPAAITTTPHGVNTSASTDRGPPRPGTLIPARANPVKWSGPGPHDCSSPTTYSAAAGRARPSVVCWSATSTPVHTSHAESPSRRVAGSASALSTVGGLPLRAPAAERVVEHHRG
jgi:hypothetical protein